MKSRTNLEIEGTEATGMAKDPVAASRRAAVDLKALALVAVATFAAYVAIVVLLDPYGVFEIAGINRRNFELSTRFAKIEYLKRRPHEGFILGTSRVNGYGRDVAAEVTGVDFYNMTAPGDPPHGMYLKLLWLADHQPLRHAIIGLDYGEFDHPIERDPSSLVWREHPDVTGESWLRFYWDNLWVDPRIHAITLYGNFIKKETWWRFDVNTGHYHFPMIEEALENDVEGLVASRYAAVPEMPEQTHVVNSEQMAYFARIVEFAQERGFRLTVVINPYYHRSYRTYDQTGHARWLKTVIAIAGEVWDFSGLNSVTIDESLYFDTSHFSFGAGALALRRIFDPGHPSLAKHPHYGIRVMPATVDAHLAKVHRMDRDLVDGVRVAEEHDKPANELR